MTIGIPSPFLPVSDAASGKLSSVWYQFFVNLLQASGADGSAIQVATGFVGDGITDDASVLQSFLTTLGQTGGIGIIPPGKYMVKTALTLSIASGVSSIMLFGYGAKLLTDPTQFIGALSVQHVLATTREDEARHVTVAGLAIDQFQNTTATFGLQAVGSPHVTFRDCIINAGSDAVGSQNYINYAAIQFEMGDISNDDTGCFWSRVENCSIKGATFKVPFGISLVGDHNAMIIRGNDFANITNTIAFGGSTAGTIANGVRVIENDFEGFFYGVSFNNVINGTTVLVGFLAWGNRIETTGSIWFNYTLASATGALFAPPVLGPNYNSSESWNKYIFNTNNLPIEVMDRIDNYATINPAPLAAGATTLLSTITVDSAASGDGVEMTALGDLKGLVLEGFVSSASTVTPRLTNPTSGSITLGSLNIIAEVRKMQ